MSERHCLTPAEFEAYVAEKPEPAERVRLSAHLASCAACRTELALFEQFHEGTARPDEVQHVAWISARLRAGAGAVRGQPESERRNWWKGFFAVAPVRRVSLALASVLVAVSATVWFRQASEPPLHSISDSGAMRSKTVVLAAPLGDVEMVPGELRWNATPGASKYQVRVTEVDRTMVWQGETAAVSVEAAPLLRDLMLPGKTLVWEVTALDPSGRTLATSGRQTFRRKGAESDDIRR